MLWEITPADEAALDRYEGFPFLYRKETVKVRLDGRLVSAMVFLIDVDYPLEMPSCYYYSVILEGYKSAGFDVGILWNSVSD